MRPILLLLVLCFAALQPASAQQVRPDPRKAELSALLAALLIAPDESSAAMLEGRIRQLWAQQGSAAATLLMNRGSRDLTNDAASDALDDFDAVLALEPNLPDAFHRRALAKFALGDYRGAVADIEATLDREPRDFAAFETLSRIAEAQGDPTGAIAAWRRALELSPKTPKGQERLKLLIRKAEGEAT